MKILPARPACPPDSAVRALRFPSKWFLLIAVSLLFFQNARATLYMTEPFDYLPGTPLTNCAPWWTNSVVEAVPTEGLVSYDLSYPPLTDPQPTNHNSLSFSSNKLGYRPIGATIGPADGTVVYCSLMFYHSQTNGGTGNAPIAAVTPLTTGINVSAANGLVLYLKQSGGIGNYVLGINDGTTATPSYPPGSQVYATGNTSLGTFGQTNFIVMKYAFHSVGGNTVALWVNPASSSFGGSEPLATPNDVAEAHPAGGSDATTGLQYFQVRGGTGATASGALIMDNVRIGTTWADVTPTCVTAGVSTPANEATSPGSTATFSVIATGSSPAFQWQTNNGVSGWVNIGGATSSSYTTPAQVGTVNNGLQFRCTVSAACDNSSVTSAAATLTVATCVPAGIATSPTNITVNALDTASFSVTASGSSPTYQWQTNNGGGWVNIGGATSATYTTPPESVANNNLEFQCVVSVACNSSSATSSPATLTVVCNTAGVSNPQNQTTIAGQTATFSVLGSGSDATYQWATNNGGGWFNIIGATNASYTTPPEIAANYGLQFQCTVSVACDGSSAVSAAAYLLVNCVTAGINSGPNSIAVGAGDTATFTVSASGSNPTYQWQTNNGGGWFNIGGATGQNYTTPPESVANNNLQYQLVVNEPCDGSSVTSSPAVLNVYPGNAIFYSTTSGNLNDPNSWEQSYDGGNTWTSPALYPPSAANSTNITVLNGDTVVNTANSQLDQVVVQAGGQITVNTGTTLTIAAGAGTDLDVSGTVDVSGTLTVNTNAPVIVESGGVLINEQGGAETVNGTLTFKSGGTYQHNYTTGAGTIPTATWNTGSSCQILGYTSDTGTLAGAAQAFYNFVWNCPSQTAAVPLGGSIPTAVNGDLNFISTGTGEVRFSNNNSPTSNITGNFNLQSGRLILASGNGKVVLNVLGNVNITGGTLSNNPSTNASGTIHFAGAGVQTFANGGLIGGPINWVVDNGSTLNGGSSVLATNLTLATGGQIRLSTTASPLFDVSGNLNNNNNTVVVDLGGATIGLGSYPLLNYGGSRSGSLNPTPVIVNGTISTGTPVIDASTPGQVNLTVVNPRTPAITGFGLSGRTLTFSGTNGTLNGSYGVLASTNLVLPLQQWTPVLLNALFDGGGNFNTNIQLTVNTNAPQQFYIMKSPTP